MVASAPKNQKASPSSFPTAIGVSDGLAASDITHQLLDWWLVPRSIRLEQMPNPPDESENKKRISVERQGRGSRQNLLAPKYSCRSDGEKNRTNNACHANPNGEFLGDTCEQEGRGPERGACGKRRGAFGESRGRPGKHHSLSDGENKKSGSNDVPLLSEELQREQGGGHDQPNTVNPPAGSLDTTFGDQRPYHSERPAKSKTN